MKPKNLWHLPQIFTIWSDPTGDTKPRDAELVKELSLLWQESKLQRDLLCLRRWCELHVSTVRPNLCDFKGLTAACTFGMWCNVIFIDFMWRHQYNSKFICVHYLFPCLPAFKLFFLQLLWSICTFWATIHRTTHLGFPGVRRIVFFHIIYWSGINRLPV